MTVATTWTPVPTPTARRPVEAPAPAASPRLDGPWFHLVGGDRPLVWLVEGSQLFEVDPDSAAALAAGDPLTVSRWRAIAQGGQRAPVVELSDEPLAVSLALAQSCNLACSYCYADQGRFGGASRRMPADVARRAVDRLVAGAAGRPVVLGFLGGEVLLHRALLHEIVAYAAATAADHGVTISFSITTNGTLVTPADTRLFRDHAFTVTVSLDGDAATSDHSRRYRNGRGSFSHAVVGVGDLLADPGRAKVVARATVTRRDLRVQERVEGLAAAGFAQAGVSPLRTGPDHDLRLRRADWAEFLNEMERAADAELARLLDGRPPRFTNLLSALREIHRGSARALPCGSAATYVAVGAGGGYFTCHRTVDDDRYALGDVDSGPSATGRRAFAESRAVDHQEPCRSCWARYLCGGGCHAEVDEVGREGCDYIRGWLEHCLGIYTRCLSAGPAAPNWMEASR